MKPSGPFYRWAGFCLFLLLLVGAIGYRISLYDRSVPVESIEDVHRRQGIPVDVMPVQRRDLELWKTVVGTLEGVEQADIVSQVNSHVVSIGCEEGDQVNVGQVLLSLYQEDPSMMVQHYQQAKSAYDRAEKAVQRIKRLYEKGAISEQKLDDAEAGYEVARSNLSAARAGVVITSPISGTVLRIYVTTGDPVSARMPLVRVGTVDQIKAVVDISAEDAGHISKGTRARLLHPGGFSRDLEGMVVRKTLSADPITRLFRVDIIFTNPDGAVQTGILVEVELQVANSQSALALPRDALVGLGGAHPYLWVLDGDRAERREVPVGLITEEWVEVLDGVSEGDWVVVRGQNLLQEGEKIFIHKRLDVL